MKEHIYADLWPVHLSLFKSFCIRKIIVDVCAPDISLSLDMTDDYLTWIHELYITFIHPQTRWKYLISLCSELLHMISLLTNTVLNFISVYIYV